MVAFRLETNASICSTSLREAFDVLQTTSEAADASATDAASCQRCSQDDYNLSHLVKSTAVVPSKPYHQWVAFLRSDQLQQIPLDSLVSGRVDGHGIGASQNVLDCQIEFADACTACHTNFGSSDHVIDTTFCQILAYKNVTDNESSVAVTVCKSFNFCALGILSVYSFLSILGTLRESHDALPSHWTVDQADGQGTKLNQCNVAAVV